MSPKAAASPRKPVNLALQGGGAHGAFTWGVLDAFLEDGRLDVKAITGTSAGAMNAVVCAEGYLEGGPEGARAQLTQFWREVSREGAFSPLQRTPQQRLMGDWSLDHSWIAQWWETGLRLFSPYQLNPMNLNPLRDFLAKIIDFERVRRDGGIKLFISATNVRTGRIRVFENQELTADMVMASACLPETFQAVMIDGEPYWDGGYMGNPALFPLFYTEAPDDIVLVQINPIHRDEVPRTAVDISNRLNEITFNASLLSEFRAIKLVKELIAQGRLSQTEYRDVRMHRIAVDDTIKNLDASSKLNAEWGFLTMLRDKGREAAQHFLARHFDAIGHVATLDLDDPSLP
ncbi:patatin-like phospholipase family protein [Labrys wisconsinensis]|uniref:NTE family protein n=1 Tax=Labrys wisconsinensis TaxID=425677 RepID=A0ABU0JKZ3_9HYPH|nr:patatin-like phospholipase family protein [Labrys wisconsinensis]MDQ0473807.1 NTE family protein [Labrys wisconsinensis]